MIKRRFVMNRTSILFLLIIGLMIVTLAPMASGTENLGDISIRVDGLTCPFWPGRVKMDSFLRQLF